jgi:hypothetical protein
VLAKNIYDGLEAAIRGAKGKVAGDDRMKGWNAYLYDDVRNGITRSLRA